MNNTKLLLSITIAAVSICCGTGPEQPQSSNTSTAYITTTAQLKSNSIPVEVLQMTNLKQLSIQGMDCDYGDTTSCWMIRQVPGEIANLKKLEILSLNVNAIRILPKEIGELKNLRILDLSDNPGIFNIDHITALENLEELSLFGCGLSNLPEDMGQLKKLKYLGLTGNNISDYDLNRIRASLPACKIIYVK